MESSIRQVNLRRALRSHSGALFTAAVQHFDQSDPHQAQNMLWTVHISKVMATTSQRQPYMYTQKTIINCKQHDKRLDNKKK